MCGLEKRRSQKIILEIAQWVSSKHATSVRDKVAKEAEELYASGLCAAAFESLQKAIYFGDLHSRALMAWLLFDGREGVAKSWKKAYVLVEEGARQGCNHSKGMMALFNFHGYGIRGDAAHKLQRSMEFARESSESGSRYGQYTLGELHRYGAGGLARDDAQALAFFGLAAAQGFDGAQHWLGYMYFNGSGVARDYAEALRWHKLAAAQGHPSAMYRVARCLYYGEGVAVARNEAIQWFRLAQAAGITEAAGDLLMLYPWL
jgi:TPR repeat protein